MFQNECIKRLDPGKLDLSYFCKVYTLQYSKTCVKRPLSKRPKIGFKTSYHLMLVKSIAECSKESILQYLRPSLSYHLSLRFVLSIFERPFYTGLNVYYNECI